MKIGWLVSFFRGRNIDPGGIFQVAKQANIDFIRAFCIETDWDKTNKVLYPYNKLQAGYDSPGYDMFTISEEYKERLRRIKELTEKYQIPVILSLFDQIHISWQDENLWHYSPYYWKTIFIRNYPAPIANYLDLDNPDVLKSHDNYLTEIKNAIKNSPYIFYEIMNEPDPIIEFYGQQKMEKFHSWISSKFGQAKCLTCANQYFLAQYGEMNALHQAGGNGDLASWVNNMRAVISDMQGVLQYFSMDGGDKPHTVEIINAIHNTWDNIYSIEVLTDFLSEMPEYQGVDYREWLKAIALQCHSYQEEPSLKPKPQIHTNISLPGHIQLPTHPQFAEPIIYSDNIPKESAKETPLEKRERILNKEDILQFPNEINNELSKILDSSFSDIVNSLEMPQIPDGLKTLGFIEIADKVNILMNSSIGVFKVALLSEIKSRVQLAMAPIQALIKRGFILAMTPAMIKAKIEPEFENIAKTSVESIDIKPSSPVIRAMLVGIKQLPMAKMIGDAINKLL